MNPIINFRCVPIFYGLLLLWTPWYRIRPRKYYIFIQLYMYNNRNSLCKTNLIFCHKPNFVSKDHFGRWNLYLLLKSCMNLCSIWQQILHNEKSFCCVKYLGRPYIIVSSGEIKQWATQYIFVAQYLLRWKFDNWRQTAFHLEKISSTLDNKILFCYRKLTNEQWNIFITKNIWRRNFDNGRHNKLIPENLLLFFEIKKSFYQEMKLWQQYYTYIYIYII